MRVSKITHLVTAAAVLLAVSALTVALLLCLSVGRTANGTLTASQPFLSLTEPPGFGADGTGPRTGRNASVVVTPGASG